MNNPISFSDWGGLHHDLLAQIYNRVVYLADRIRFPAVCKHWQLCADDNKDAAVKTRIPYTIPWIFKHGFMWSNGEDVHPFASKLIDPYSKCIHRLSSCSRERFSPTEYFNDTIAYASKSDGWVLLSHRRDNMILPCKTSLFLRNVYTSEVVLLPLLDLDCVAATFIKDTPREFRVMAVGFGGPSDTKEKFSFASISLLKDKDWKVYYAIKSRPGQEVCSLYYFSGRLYCAWNNGGLVRYNVFDGNYGNLILFGWESVHDCWLVENNAESGLLGLFFILSRSETGEWSVRGYDQLRTNWFTISDMKSTAFFVSGKVAIRSPLVNFDGEEVDDCRVYYDTNGLIQCYSLCQKTHIELDSWIGKIDNGKICFVEPPPVREETSGLSRGTN